MTICFFANAASIHTYRWVTYFVKKGHKISIISLKPSTFDYGEIDVFILKGILSTPTFFSHLVNFLPFVLYFWWLGRQINPDVFHALGSSNGLLAAIAGFKPLILTIADPGLFSITNKYPIRKSDLLVCDGENTKKAMIKLGADPEKIKMIRYGVDLNKFKPQRDWERNPKIVISTKPLRSESDVGTLIKAVPIILKEVPDARFIIMGDGDQKESLINLAESLKVSKAIDFTGDVSSDKIPWYLNSANVFVNTSLIDTGLASSTAEAMACGLPMVVSDSGDNKLWIKNGENGFIFPLRDFEALAEEVICLLKNKNLRMKVSKTNREIIKETNDYHKEMDKMEKLYKEYEK